MTFEAKAWDVPYISARNPEDRAKDEDLIVMAIRHILNDKAGADQTEIQKRQAYRRHFRQRYQPWRLPGGSGLQRVLRYLALALPRYRAALTARDGDRTIKPQKRQAYRPCKIA